MMYEKPRCAGPSASPYFFWSKRRSRYTVQPSLSQNESQLTHEVRLPLHEWHSSCSSTSVALRSPHTRLGVSVVRFAFSMPPYGNDGGSTTESYRVQTYGATTSSASAKKRSASASNSHCTASASGASAHTPVRGPSVRKVSSPPTIASRYVGIDTGCRKAYCFCPPPTSFGSAACSADISTGIDEVTVAVYVILRPGASKHGTSERAWIAWHCEYRNGACFACVCSRDSQPSAVHASVVA